MKETPTDTACGLPLLLQQTLRQILGRCADVCDAMKEQLVPVWHVYVQHWLTEPQKHDPVQYFTNNHKRDMFGFAF